MGSSHSLETKAKDINIEVLADEAMRLLEMDMDELFTMLGAQLLARNLPSRVAGFVSYLSAIRSESIAKSLYESLPSTIARNERGRVLGVICENLKRDGMGYFSEVTENLRKALCNEDLFRFSEQVNRSTIQLIVTIIGAALRMPRDFDAISTTLAVILLKLGLRDFCQQPKAT